MSMIVLHGVLRDDQFLLWGEAAIAVKTPRPRGRKPKQPRALPFAAAAPDLIAALDSVLPQNALVGREVSPCLVWLPTIEGGPLPSTPLIAEPPRTDQAPTLRPWSVPAPYLKTEEILDLLGACADREVLAPGVLIGADLRYWVQAMRFAGSLVIRQRFLPDLLHDGDGWAARWRSVTAGADAERLARLAAAMPGACRALTGERAVEPPGVSAAQSLGLFVDRLVDHLVRIAQPEAGGPPWASLHDQWMHALSSPDGRLRGDRAAMAAFAQRVRDWQRPVSVLQSAPFRLVFRLEEPEEEAGSGWSVGYLLQATDDPSLLIPVDEAWTAKGAIASALRERKLPVREFLLTALGQAARLCPEVETSLSAATPDRFPLDTHGAHHFLTVVAPALEQAGFGVMLPAWWTGRGRGARLTARAHARSTGMTAGQGLTFDALVAVDWQVALGEESLTLAELKALAKLKSPLVKLRGRWVEVSASDLHRAADLLKRTATRRVTAGALVEMALGGSGESTPLPVDRVTAEGPLAELLAVLEGNSGLVDLSPPAGFTGTLRPYQNAGYSWMAFLQRWGLGACLADDMGLGKTIQTLALIQRAREGGEQRPVLLVCPTSVAANWHREAARFTPELSVLVHHGPGRLRGTELAAAALGQTIIVTTYALLHRDGDALAAVPWAAVILDEAQNIKNAGTKQAQAARRLDTGFRLALTGTPVENNVGDLWSLMQFLHPGLLGNQAEFRRRFFLPIQVQGDIEAAARLQQLTRPFILRRLKTDRKVITDLPEKIESRTFCTLTKEQASLYAAVVREAEETLEGAEGIERRGLVLATLTRLKQICNHPAHFLADGSALTGRSGKLARLAEMVEELLAAGDRALIFTQYAEMGHLIRRDLQERFGRPVLFLHGGVPKAQRDLMVEQFGQTDGPPLFVLSLKAGGTGLNLTQANHVFHFDRWWNPAVENQATDRAFRIGQTRTVQVHKFLCAGTLEEKIDDLITRKQELAERIVGAGEQWLTELSTADLKALVALEQGVGEDEG